MKKYYNLTASKGKRMVYFRSTDVEQMNYERLLWSVPDEWLYLLYKGKQIMIIDKSSNGKGKIEKIFIPVLNDVLKFQTWKWCMENKNLKQHFYKAMEAINSNKSLEKKYTFWCRRFKHPINIKAKTIHVRKERSIL